MFKEGAERKTVLHEDQPGMVERMVYYFYNFDYACDNTEGEQKRPLGPVLQLKMHIPMYSTADKYDVPGLKALACEKFKESLGLINTSWTYMVSVTHEVAKVNLPESDTTLRDLLVDAWLLGGTREGGLFALLLSKHPEGFETLMKAAPWLSLAVHKRTLPSLRFSHVARQANCEKCKNGVFFTQGNDTATCRTCKGELPLKAYNVLPSEVLVARDELRGFSAR